MLTGNNLFSQSKAELKNTFYDAESWILFEAYKDALPLYLQLLKLYPDNSNFKYRVGQCYLNSPGEKEIAIRYLEEAAKNINPKYREGKFRESGAPYDALYYLANAYRINNELDKAIETYGLFKKNLDPEIYDTIVVDMQIQSCRNAKVLMGMPKFIRKQNLGSVINESTSEFNPVVSDDETMIVYSKTEAFYEALLFSVKTDGKWSVPQNMNEMLKVDRDIFPTSLSSDGKTLYLYSSADYDGIIYSSTYENGTWSLPVMLNDNINTKYWESHATVSHDNKRLYFTSNRQGTYGGLDIFVSERDSTGDWGPAVNLGPVINSPYNEESPFLSKDDKTLYFSSRGHFNMGGYDIFSSVLNDKGEWSEPLNEGYPLNTTDDDVFYKPAVENYKGFYAMDSPEGYGKLDIYEIELFSDEHPRKFLVSGSATVEGLQDGYRDSVKVDFLNDRKQGKALTVYTNPETREYTADVPQGEYKVNYEGYGGERVTRDLNLPLTFSADNFVMPGVVLPRTDHTAELTVEGSRNITVTKGDSILIPLKVEPLSSLNVESWSGDVLVSSLKYEISTPGFEYRIAPKPGDNRVVFKLTDRFSNTAIADVFIRREKSIATEKVVRPEYAAVLSRKQTEAYLVMLGNRADKNISHFIAGSDARKHEFSKSDDLLSFLKSKATESNIKAEDIDKLALRVAVSDNVLTQSATDILGNYADGDLKNILTGTDIYRDNLKTWADLQKFVTDRSGGKITSRDLDDLANLILAETDPGITVIKDKIAAYGSNSESGAILTEAVGTTDKADIRLRGKWLDSFYNESVSRGLTPIKLSAMIVIISSQPGTETQQYLSELAANSGQQLASALKSADLAKEKIKSPEDLVLFLIMSKDRTSYPEDAVFKAIANMIVKQNIPAETITAAQTAHKGGKSWIIWVVIGGLLVFLYLAFGRRMKSIKK